jgi:hypothetical protein
MKLRRSELNLKVEPVSRNGSEGTTYLLYATLRLFEASGVSSFPARVA